MLGRCDFDADRRSIDGFQATGAGAGPQEILEPLVYRRSQALEESRLEVLDRLARTAEFHDDATGQHPRRVGRTATILGSTTSERSGFRTPSQLKPEALSPDKEALMKQHTTIGAEIFSGGRSPQMRLAEEIALSHHERWDGTGRISPETAKIIRRPPARGLPHRSSRRDHPDQTPKLAAALWSCLTSYIRASATARAASGEAGAERKVVTPMLKVTGRLPSAIADSSSD